MEKKKMLTIDDLKAVRGGLADGPKKWVKSEEEGVRGTCECKVEYEKHVSQAAFEPVGF